MRSASGSTEPSTGCARTSGSTGWPMTDAVGRIREDQRRQWEGGRRALVEEYLAGDPAVAADPELVLDLIYSEVLLREDLGDRIEPAEYLGRFPPYAAPLARQFELHAL